MTSTYQKLLEMLTKEFESLIEKILYDNVDVIKELYNFKKVIDYIEVKVQEIQITAELERGTENYCYWKDYNMEKEIVVEDDIEF